MYTFHDYEEAYYHADYNSCKRIGLALLGTLSDKNSKRLYKKLEAVEIDYLATQKERKKLADILVEVRIWLGVNL